MRFVQAGVMLLGTAFYVYFLIAMFTLDPDFGDAMLPMLIGWNAALLIVTVLVIVDSVRKIRRGRTRELAAGVFLVKLISIPFFLINFAILALVGLLGLALTIHGPGILFVGMTGVAAVLTYLTMLSTSIYGWAAVVRLRRDGLIDRVLAVTYTLTLLLFVMDIVAGILIYRHAVPLRRSRALAA